MTTTKEETAVYTYKVPPRLSKKIKTGDTVVVHDSQMQECGYAKVKRVVKTFVETMDGRRWLPQNGYWLDENKTPYPFPSIRPVMLQLTMPDKEWMKDLKAKGFTADTTFDKGQLEELKMRLLNIAGAAACLPVIEEDYRKILERGYCQQGRAIVMKKGRDCACHSNSAACWEANESQLTICTGYGLSEDAVWRQHSWCVFTETGQIVETTTKRRLYYGYRLDAAEAQSFFDSNI